MHDRRSFLKAAGAGSVTLAGCLHKPQTAGIDWVNDAHSQLNRTRVAGITRPEDPEAIQQLLRRGHTISICGGRHAMGGQQFGTDNRLVDTGSLDKVLQFDRKNGLLEVEAGIQWPAVLKFLEANQANEDKPWGFAQKQTGADKLALGGALSANAHGRGLQFQPFVQDVESLRLINAEGDIVNCSRTSNTELFRHVIGGYGLFGLVYSLKLRLVPRQKLKRQVEIIHVRDLLPRLNQQLKTGALYGDFQFNIDSTNPNFLQEGVFSSYVPVPMGTPIPENQRKLPAGAWKQLIHLAHKEKAGAYEMYTRHYKGTHGQVYWSDAHQMSWYEEGYHKALEQKTGLKKGTEMISEVYVPREELAGFLASTANEFRKRHTDVIYGTVRFIHKDETTALPWAKQDYACIVLNLHVDHDPAGLAKAENDFRKLIDLALERDGSFFLTYHRWATRQQIETAYPTFRDFLAKKKQWDPDERFQSDWYRHHRDLLC
jgi:FAD/FMN-containing dehydrogenase